MKRRPSHRLYRRSVKRMELEKRIRDWAWKIRQDPNRDAITIGCHTVTHKNLIEGKHIPGIPK